MPLLEDEVRKLITSYKTGKVEEIYGPAKFGGDWIWEIWVDNGDSKSEYWETRFLVETSSGTIFFDSFIGLSGHLNDTYQAATYQSGTIDWTRTKEMAELKLKTITLYVASVVFSATMLTMLIVVFLNETGRIPKAERSDNISLIVSAVLGIISSGGALYFGRWLPFQDNKEKPTITARAGGRRKKA